MVDADPSAPVSRWLLLAALAGAGALGTLARYGVSVAVGRLHGEEAVIAPAGTVVVNAVGCFLFGLVWAWSAARAEASVELKLVVLTGFMGAFTTFSTFGFETMHLMRSGAWGTAAGYVLLQNVLGVGLAFVGFWLGGRGVAGA